jgi:hypothetical protein
MVRQGMERKCLGLGLILGLGQARGLGIGHGLGHDLDQGKARQG